MTLGGRVLQQGLVFTVYVSMLTLTTFCFLLLVKEEKQGQHMARKSHRCARNLLFLCGAYRPRSETETCLTDFFFPFSVYPSR